MCVATAAAAIAVTQSGMAAYASQVRDTWEQVKCSYCGTYTKVFSALASNCRNCGAAVEIPNHEPIQKETRERSRPRPNTQGTNQVGQGDIVSEGSTGTVFPRSSDVSGSYGDSTPSYDTGIPECHVPHHQEESQTTGGSFGLTPDASTTIESPSPTTET